LSISPTASAVQVAQPKDLLRHRAKVAAIKGGFIGPQDGKVGLDELCDVAERDDAVVLDDRDADFFQRHQHKIKCLLTRGPADR
jgi:hypothetical protein